jgi:hypothetical protein
MREWGAVRKTRQAALKPDCLSFVSTLTAAFTHPPRETPYELENLVSAVCIPMVQPTLL